MKWPDILCWVCKLPLDDTAISKLIKGGGTPFQLRDENKWMHRPCYRARLAQVVEVNKLLAKHA